MKKTLTLIVFLSLFISGFSQKIIYLDETTFKEKIWDYEKNPKWRYEGEIPAIIDFYADWCGPCKLLAPHLQELQDKYGTKIQVYKVNVDKNVEIAKLFDIKSIPTLIYATKNNDYDKEIGYREKDQIENKIHSKLKVN